MAAALYVFTRDLRLDDNPALSRALEFNQLHCLFVVEQFWFIPGRYQVSPLGQHRWQFLQESLEDLSAKLAGLGQSLDVRHGEWVDTLVEQLDRTGSDTLIISRPVGWYEKKQLELLLRRRPGLNVITVDSLTLFDRGQAEWLDQSLPKQFTPFRRLAESVLPATPLATVTELPAPSRPLKPQLSRPAWVPVMATTNPPFCGGETAGRDHLNDYFSSSAPLSYKETRNELQGWECSSKWSPWLALGCISVRRVFALIGEYETTRGSNDSTEWLRFELLWREYFQWSSHQLGSELFTFQGMAKKPPLTSFYAQRLQSWCHGNTQYPLVNALMQELKQTGYMSNRGRQIAASCLVNELSVDWRYGAAWFEHQLVDYDVASNWGNWQYIAGVGVDPRGGRHFDLSKQQQQFDADGSYQRRWLNGKETASGLGAVPEYTVDAADWPLG